MKEQLNEVHARRSTVSVRLSDSQILSHLRSNFELNFALQKTVLPNVTYFSVIKNSWSAVAVGFRVKRGNGILCAFTFGPAVGPAGLPLSAWGVSVLDLDFCRQLAWALAKIPRIGVLLLRNLIIPNEG